MHSTLATWDNKLWGIIGVRIYTDRQVCGQLQPYYLGFAYRLPHLRASVFAPIPFNYIIGWTRNLWFRLMSGPRDRLSEAMAKQYAMEYRAGYERGITEGQEEGRKLGWNQAFEGLTSLIDADVEKHRAAAEDRHS